MRALYLLAITAIFTPHYLSAQQSAAVEGLACFENLPTPEYPAAALRSHVDGSVWTNTEINPQGGVTKVESQVVSAWADGSRLLTPPVEKAIRAAKIKPECAGKTVSVVFRYQLYGDATPTPKVTSKADPPHMLWIENQPESAAGARTETSSR